MQLVMGISADGFVSKGPNDNMSWLGRDDKIAFKLLTLGANKMLGASARTADLMPAHLPGRDLKRISRSNYCLEAFYDFYPEGILIGGQTLALAALEKGMIDRVHLCISTKRLLEQPDIEHAQRDMISQHMKLPLFKMSSMTIMNQSTVYTWDKVK